MRRRVKVGESLSQSTYLHYDTVSEIKLVL